MGNQMEVACAVKRNPEFGKIVAGKAVYNGDLAVATASALTMAYKFIDGSVHVPLGFGKFPSKAPTFPPVVALYWDSSKETLVATSIRNLIAEMPISVADKKLACRQASDLGFYKAGKYDPLRVELQVMVNLLDIPRERQPPARKLIEEASALELKRREEAAAVRAAELTTQGGACGARSPESQSRVERKNTTATS
jgi:hypothetical protein